MDLNTLSGNVYVVLSSVCIGDVNINSKYPPSRFMLNIHENSQLYHGHDWCWINSSPLSAPVGPHVGPINRAIRECLSVAHPGDFEVIIEFVSYLIIWPWASCQIRKIVGWHTPGMPEMFSPTTTSKETTSYLSRHASRHVRRAHAVMHVGIDNSRCRGKRSRHSQRMRNPWCYVSGKRPIN